MSDDRLIVDEAVVEVTVGLELAVRVGDARTGIEHHRSHSSLSAMLRKRNIYLFAGEDIPSVSPRVFWLIGW